jgi:hypothetical protein
LPDGSKVHRAAGNYIAGLPKREHDMFAWRVAIEALMLVAEHGGDIMSPRIGIIRPIRRSERSARATSWRGLVVPSSEGCVASLLSLPEWHDYVLGRASSSSLSQIRPKATKIARARDRGRDKQLTQ